MGAACSKNKSKKGQKSQQSNNPNDTNKNQPVMRPANTGHLANTNEIQKHPDTNPKLNEPNQNIHFASSPHMVAEELSQQTSVQPNRDPAKQGSNPNQIENHQLTIDNSKHLTNLDKQQEKQLQQSQTKPNVQPYSANTDPKEPITLKNLYLFGIDTDESPKIVRFNPLQNQNQVELIKPCPNLELYNLGGSVYISEKEIYLTGGINPYTMKTSNRAFVYNAQENTATELASFSQHRYSHIAAVYKNKLFVIGGFLLESNNENVILASCEFLPLGGPAATWTKTADMMHPRACGFHIIYNDKLYVMGGYSGNSKRPKIVEIYNENLNRWDAAEFKIPRGVEYPIICAADRDELHIIGGNVREGVIRSNILLNLRTKTYMSKRSMHKERVFHKSIVMGSEIWVFGGEDDDTVEVYDAIRDEWRFGDIDYKRYVQYIQSFSAAAAPLVILSKQDMPGIELSKSSITDTRAFLFGDDKTPFILELNFTKKFTKEKPLPVGLKLFAYQSVVNLGDGRYFLHGGVSPQGQSSRRNAYIYDPQRNEVKKCAKSKLAPYVSNAIKKGNYVYVIGGQTYSEGHEVLAECERYNIQNDVWETLPSLNHPRCSGMCFLMDDKIVIVGGYKGNFERWNNAEILDEAQGKWKVVNTVGLPPLEGAGVLTDPRDNKSVLIFQGVTNEFESQKIWKMRDNFVFEELKGTLKDKRTLAKVCAVDNSTVCLIGGERTLFEFFDLQKGDTVHNSFGMDIESAITKMIFIDGQLDKSLTNFGFA